jgi:geranylgeranyl pyrophosphate synthase
MSEQFSSYLQQCSARVNQALDKKLGSFHSSFTASDSSEQLAQLKQAITYSLLNGGKRIRPLLVYAAAKSINPNTDRDELDTIACAVEMIHTYSLVHDDLPAMDDDDLRRGKPSCHCAFDEATAILCGDALQSRAFELLASLQSCPAPTALELIKTLASAAGQAGMVGGQAIDLAAVNKTISLEQLETLHRLKTGALIRASVAMGAQFAGANVSQRAALDDYAQCIGLAFQVQDDILDIEGDTEILGKPQGADQALNKPTYPSLIGLPASKQKARDLHQQALAALDIFDDNAQTLRDLSAYIISRTH